MKTSLKNIRGDIENLQSSINTHNEKIHNAREELNALQEEQLKIRSNIQKLNQLKEKQENLFAKEISLGKSVDNLRQTSVTAKTNLNSALAKLEKKRKENRDKQEIDRNKITQGTRRLSELEKADNDLSVFVFRKLPEELERSEAKIKNYETSINNLQREKNNIETTINKLKEEITRQEVRKRDLSDNILLRKTHETTKALQQQCSNLKNELNAINYAQLMDEWKNLQNREEALLRQVNHSS